MSAPLMVPVELPAIISRALLALSTAQAATDLELPVQAVQQALHATFDRMARDMGVEPRRRARTARRAPFKARVPRALPGPTPEELELRPSVWDPDHVDDRREAERYRALLLEVIRRAAHDWVLYRQHNRLLLKQTAEDAYIWLFEERPGHPWWRERLRDGRSITGFLTICEILDLDPRTVRERVRAMDVRTIIGAGRPPENRRRPVDDEPECSAYGMSADVDVMSMDDDPQQSTYENYFSVDTLGYQ